MVGRMPTWSCTSSSQAEVHARRDALDSPPVRSRSRTGANSPVWGCATETKTSAWATAFATTPFGVEPAGRAKWKAPKARPAAFALARLRADVQSDAKPLVASVNAKRYPPCATCRQLIEPFQRETSIPRAKLAALAGEATTKTARSRAKRRRKPQSLAPAGHRFQLGDLDGAGKPAELALLEPSRSDLERRGGSRGHRRAEGVFRRLALQPRGQERRQEDVSRADDRDGIDARRGRAEPVRRALLAEQRVAPGRLRDQHVAGAPLGDRVEADDEVVDLVELLADETLGLVLIRRHQVRLGVDAESQGLAFRVQNRVHTGTVEIADRLAVKTFVDVPWQRAGEDDGVRALRQVVELLPKHLELLRPHDRPPLVDLRVGRGCRIDDGRGGARLVLDSYEVVQDRFARQLLDDANAGAPADEPRRDDRDAEQLQRPGDVDALAACQHQALARAVALSALEVRHRERAVEGRVQRDGDDHVSLPVAAGSVTVSSPRRDRRYAARRSRPAPGRRADRPSGRRRALAARAAARPGRRGSLPGACLSARAERPPFSRRRARRAAGRSEPA